MKKVEIVGMKLNRLRVISEYPKRTNAGKVQFLCKCDCGNEVVVIGSKLINGHTKSCKCMQREAVKKTGDLNRTHSRSRTRVYKVWGSMKSRCYNKGNDSYYRYGGRGITVCDRWRYSFESFLEDMGECGLGLSIDRIDNNGNYEPSNCKWSTQIEQENNKSTNRIVLFNGERFTVSQLSRKIDVKYQILYGWIRRGTYESKIKEICKKKS